MDGGYEFRCVISSSMHFHFHGWYGMASDWIGLHGALHCMSSIGCEDKMGLYGTGYHGQNVGRRIRLEVSKHCIATHGIEWDRP